MSSAKIGLRYLWRRKVRTAATLFSVILGVAVLVGVNVASDTLGYSIYSNISQKLGATDAIIRNMTTADEEGNFFWSDLASTVEANENVLATAPRAVTRWWLWWENVTTGEYRGGYVCGVVTDGQYGNIFGHCRVNASLDPALVGTSDVEPLVTSSRWLAMGINHPIAISLYYSQYYNVSVGVELRAWNYVSDSWNPEVFKVTGIIEDYTEATYSFSVDTEVDNWEILPPEHTIYMDLGQYWDHIQRPNEVNFLLVQFTDLANTAEKISSLNTTANSLVHGGVWITYDPKETIMYPVNQATSIIRVFFSIFAAISLLICAVVIKNLFEMAKEEQVREIGVMRAIGMQRMFVFQSYAMQVLVISCIGVVGGIFLGQTLAGLFADNALILQDIFGENIYQDFAVVLNVSDQTLYLGIGAGLGVPLLFGLIPARQAAHTNVIEALHPTTQTKKQRILSSVKQTTISLILSAIMVAAGIFLTDYGAQTIPVILDNPEEIVNASLLFVGTIVFLVGVVFLTATLLPILAKSIAATLAWFLGKMYTVTYRNIIRNRRRSQNVFAMVAIGFAFMIAVTTVMNSADAGAYPGAMVRVGGDYATGAYWRTIDTAFNVYDTFYDTPHATAISPFALRYDVSSNEPFKIGAFGGEYPTTEGSLTERIYVGIINATEYAKIHANNLLFQNKLIAPVTNLSEFVLALRTPYTIVLEDRIAKTLALEVGMAVELVIENLPHAFTVVGIADILPGIESSYQEDNDPLTDNQAALISWESIDALMGDYLGDTDLVIKRQLSNGYLGKGFNRTVLLDLLAKLPDVEVVESRLTSFNVIPQRLSYNVGHEYVFFDGTPPTIGTWSNFSAQFIAADYSQMGSFGGAQIVEVNESVPADHRTSVESILSYFTEINPSELVCVVNAEYVWYSQDGAPNAFSIYRFRPGDKVRLFYDGGGTQVVDLTFTVVATVAGNTNYRYSPGTGLRDIVSPAEKVGNILNFQNDRVFTENYFEDKIAPGSNFVYVPFSSIAGILGSKTTAFLRAIELDQYSGYGALEKTYAPWDLVNLCYARLTPTANHTLVTQRLYEYFLNTTTFNDFLGFSAELQAGLLGRIYQAYFVGGIDAVENVPSLEDYLRNNYDWESYFYFVSAVESQSEATQYIGVVYNLFILIISLSLIISLMGLASAMIISIYQRQSEIGTLRAMGFQRTEILKMVFGETLTLALIGIIVGIVGGIVSSFLMLGRIPFLLYLPIIFLPDWGSILLLSGILTAVAIVTAVFPAIIANRVQISDAIRTRGE